MCRLNAINGLLLCLKCTKFNLGWKGANRKGKEKGMAGIGEQEGQMTVEGGIEVHGGALPLDLGRGGRCLLFGCADWTKATSATQSAGSVQPMRSGGDFTDPFPIAAAM